MLDKTDYKCKLVISEIANRSSNKMFEHLQLH